MIPILILYALRKLKGCNRAYAIAKLKRIAIGIITISLLLTLTSITSSNKSGDSTPLQFDILKDNIVIGNIKINKLISGEFITYELESKITAKYVLKFNIVGKEKSIYKEGILVYSYVFRTLNNKIKVNHTISFNADHYTLEKENKLKSLDLKNITQNLITLYFKEPIDNNTVFCDNQGEMLHIKSLGNGMYKVEFSDVKYNIFHYKNGKCIKVEAVSPMFDVILIPS